MDTTNVLDASAPDHVAHARYGAIPLMAGALVRPVWAFRQLGYAMRLQWLVPALLLSLIMIAHTISQAPFAARGSVSISISLQGSRDAPPMADTPSADPAPTDAGSFLHGVTRVVGAWIGWGVQSVILLALAALLGGRASWRKLFTALPWSSLPLAVGYALAIAWTALTGQPAELNASQFVAPAAASATSPDAFAARAALISALRMIDPFVLWHWALVGIAAAVVAGLSWRAGAIAGFANAALGVLAAAAPAWIAVSIMAQSGGRMITP